MVSAGGDESDHQRGDQILRNTKSGEHWGHKLADQLVSFREEHIQWTHDILDVNLGFFFCDRIFGGPTNSEATVDRRRSCSAQKGRGGIGCV